LPKYLLANPGICDTTVRLDLEDAQQIVDIQ
jgi:hypothetical protein